MRKKGVVEPGLTTPGRGYHSSSRQTQICHDPLYWLPSPSLLPLLELWMQPLSLVLSPRAPQPLFLSSSNWERVRCDVCMSVCVSCLQPVWAVAYILAEEMQRCSSADAPVFWSADSSCLVCWGLSLDIMNHANEGRRSLTGLLWVSMQDTHSFDLHLITVDA